MERMGKLSNDELSGDEGAIVSVVAKLLATIRVFDRDYDVGARASSCSRSFLKMILRAVFSAEHRVVVVVGVVICVISAPGCVHGYRLCPPPPPFSCSVPVREEEENPDSPSLPMLYL